MNKTSGKREAARPAAARGRPALLIGGVVVAAVVAVAVLIWPNLQSALGVAAPASGSTDYALADGKALGPADARVVVQVFSDFQCPYCRQFAASTERQVLETYILTGQSVRLEYKHFIVIDGNVGGSESRHAAEASECAAEQGLFWQYHDLLFANVQGEGTGSLRDERLRAIAEAGGLEMTRFGTCFDTARFARNVTADEALARQLGVTGTPGVFVNAVFVQDFTDFAEVASLIDAALGQ